MSACSCGWAEILGGRHSKPQIARKSGFYCGTCGAEVKPGQLCVDTAYLYADGGGNFLREHAICHRLAQKFKAKLCADGWAGEGDWFGGLGGNYGLQEAAKHAVAEGHDPYWREWLELYEQSWEFWEDDR